MATSSPSKRKEVTALNGDYWKPLEEKKRRRTAPPVFTVEDPFYSKIEKNLIKTVIDESKDETPKKSKDKTPKKEKDIETPKKSTDKKKKRNSKTEETKKSPKQSKEKEETPEVVVIPDSPTRVRKSGNRSYIRRSASSSPSTKNAKAVEKSSNRTEPVDGTESEVSYKKEDTDSEIDIISLDEDEPKPQQQQDTKPIEVIDDDEKDTKSKDQEKSTRKRKKKEEPEQKKVKKLKKETKLKRTSSSKSRTLKGAKHEKSLRLDEALSRTDMEGWSSARINAYRAIETNPNMYYYRFNAPGEKQRNGGWTEEEKELFQQRMKELGGTGDYQWGIFSMAIPGRVGYQCANFYRKMIKEGEIKDENYSLNDKGEPVYIGGKAKKKAKSKEEKEESKSPKKKKQDKENVVDNKKKKEKNEVSPKKKSPKKESNDASPKKESPKKSSSSPKKLKQMKLDALFDTPEKPKRGRPRKGDKKKKKQTEEEKTLKKQQDTLRKQQEKDMKAQRKLDLERELEERLKGKEIIPRIFLGNKDVARNQDWLQENGVKHVVNVTREVGNYYEEDFKYKRIMIDDSMDQDIAKHFEDSCEFISKALKEDEGSVLVHCNEGRSRSVTLIIAYLMKHENMNLSSAFNHIHSKSTTKINDGFKRQLMSYELALGKEKSIEFFPSRRNSKENVLNTSGSRVSTPVIVKEVSIVKEVVEEEVEQKEEVSEMKSLFSKVLSSTTTQESTNLQLPASDSLSFMSLDEIPETSPPAPNQLIKIDPSLEKTMVIPPVAAATVIDRTDSISDMEEEPLSDPMYWGAEIFPETTNAVPPTPQNPKAEELLSVGLDDEWLNGILTP